MQGLHHQQQQLAALLAAALPKDDQSSSLAAPSVPSSASTSVSASPSPSSSAPSDDDSARVSAINSLNRAILHPHNALVVSHSASFLAQGLFQLLSDKSYTVRRSAVIAYGSLCSLSCSSQLSANGRQTSIMVGGLGDRFIGWALPNLRNMHVNNGEAELALEGLREFLNIGDAGGTDRYVLPILKACQELLEDERTSSNLLRQLLDILTVISLKFSLSFQSHFLDIVDLLLGWALLPDLLESDRCIIMDSFLQFKKHWLGNLQFSLGLLSKFLGDIEAVLQDGTLGTPKQLTRLLPLLSCFLTVLQIIASGMLEINLLNQISSPLEDMLHRLLACLLMVGTRFGWSKWMRECWSCLILFAEILQEKFAVFYTMAFDILFQNSISPAVGCRSMPSFEANGILKTNLQLLSLQKFALLPSTIQRILELNSPMSLLRLHPNFLVTGTLAETYLFLFQHDCNGVVEQAITSLLEELELLKSMLEVFNVGNLKGGVMAGKLCKELDGANGFSQDELLAVIKFDLKILIACVCLENRKNILDQLFSSKFNRSVKFSSFILERMNPFKAPFQAFADLQVHIVKALQKLSIVEFESKISLAKGSKPTSGDPADFPGSTDLHDAADVQIAQYLSKYSRHIVAALHETCPITVKLEALDWIQRFCTVVMAIKGDADLCGFSNKSYFYCDVKRHATIGTYLLYAVLDAAFDREVKVRSQATAVLDLLLQASLISHVHFRAVAEVSLEKLGDPCNSIKNGFLRVLSVVLPLTFYIGGMSKDELGASQRHGVSFIWMGTSSYWHWKQLFAVKQLLRQFKPQHLVSIFSYISQRWKVSLSNWIQRLVFSCQINVNDFIRGHLSNTEELKPDGLWMNLKIGPHILDKICSVNVLAAAWLSIHEAARYCILVRLRTHLGGPTQTFAALERMLMDVAQVLHVDSEHQDGSLNIASNTHLLPMRLLLDFVEALKKNVYNAYDGSSVLPPSTPQSSLFFRANKKVCEEWFARICEPMLNAGLALQCYPAILHYSALRLHDLCNTVMSALKDKHRGQVAEGLRQHRAKNTEEVLKVLRYVSLAMCRSHDPDALVGLQEWATVTFSSLLQEEFQSTSGYIAGNGQFSWMTGLAYQAQGHYEKAAAHFTHLLESEEALSSLGSGGVQFTIARVIECYAALSDWKSLESWLLELQGLRAKHAGKNYSGALTAAGNEMNAILSLARFDEGDVQGSWSYLDLTPKSSTELTIDPKQALQRSEQMLLQAMLHKDMNMDKTVEDLKKAELMLEEVLSVVPLDGLNESAAYATQLQCIRICDEGCKFVRGQNQSSLTSTVQSPLNQVWTSPVSQIHQDCGLWLKVLRVYRTVMPNSAATLQLCLQLITLARKQTNFMLAHRLQHYLMEVLPTCPKCELMDTLSTSLQYENILLKYAEAIYEDALASLWSFVHGYMLSPPNAVLTDCNGTLKAKACLKLASWLKQENLAVDWENALVKIHTDYLEFNLFNVSIDGHESLMSKNRLDSDVSLVMKEIAGIATKLSTRLCPKMGKAWFSYASWCYHQGVLSLAKHPPALQSSSLSSVLSPEVSSGRFALTREEILRVESIILNLFLNKAKGVKGASMVDEEVIVWSGSEFHLEGGTAIRVLIERAIYLIQAAAGAPGVEDSDGESISRKLAAQLQFLLINADAAAEKSGILSSVNELVDIWWLLRRRRLSMFGHAAKGFIQYLSMSTVDNKEAYVSDSLYSDMGRQKKDNGILRAALHVLHILLNYGVEFKDILEHGFSTVSALPWQEITPQLFARVSSHPQQVVRKQLEGLLLTLAKMSPWSIVYPTLVEINAYEGGPSEELQHILGCLVKLHPKLVQDVELVINELGSITVLWEEQWLATLQDLHTDVIRRINVLKEEVSRVAENATLSLSEKTKINAAKYSAMMAPIAVALERRLASTSRKPETAHETWFQNEYGEQLKSAVSAFKVPPTSAAVLADVWRPFDAIAASLATHQRKPTITLSDVAPQLAHFSASDVPMPGLEKNVTPYESFESFCPDLQGIITISSFCEQVVILSTKTKPKKLGILGSDGKKYTYLLKGREDLRLDARIMQFLQAVNSLLYSCKDARSRSLFVRHYSVTPISGRAGLIQWVDNVISIYSVFKSWQSHMQIGQVSASGAGNGNGAHPPVPRPSDMFYGKIIPALKEKGIRKVISRRDWPHEVKRKVLLELMKEVPRQLLHREIWCSSEGFKAFNTKLMRYSGSMAAMSMVGYVLGLGDRHLDNILIDFSSGDIVHIDYNVCFDKGQRLKVPEIVPFRLTQTLETALGLTGTEGVFRANCEAVMNVLQKNKSTLLMLLEVFVWDPLVEWTRGDIHDEAAVGGEERKGMELAVSLSLFASRVQEIRVPLQEHHDLFLSTVPEAVSALERFADALNCYEVASALFYHADQERSRLLLHESSAKSIVAEATSDSEQKRASFEIQACELAQAKATATEKAQEAAMWMEHHGRVLDALCNGSAPELQPGIRFSTLGEALSLTSAVLAAGIPLTIVPEPTKVQCHDLDKEVAQIIADLDSDLSSAVKSLQTYALALQRILPLNYATSSKVHGWAQLLQLAVNNLSSELLTLARRQAADLALVRGDKPDFIHQRYEALHHDIESTINEIRRVQKECSELESSIDLETEIKSKDRLLSAFSKYMQSVGHSRKEEEEPYLVSSQTKRHDGKDLKTIPLDIEDKKSKVLSVLHLAVVALYNEVKAKVFEISANVTGGVMWSSGTDALHSNSKLCYCELEEQIEKCTLVASTVHEIHELSSLNVSKRALGSGSTLPAAEGNWASIFQASIQASRNLVEQMTRSVLPEITKSIISQNSAVMEAFGSLSQIRGSIDTAVEQLVQIELERMSFLELEENYFMKVGLITEQQLALSEAALKGRDHLSWEEAEELASREEACKAQLDQLHQMWSQKDVHAASLRRRESAARNTIISAEQRFLNVVTVEQGGDLQLVRSKLLLAALMNPFSDLESVDRFLSLFSMEAAKETSINIPDVLSSGYPLVETIWKASGLLKNHSFFIWKLCVVDSFLDSCLHDVSSSLDHNLGFDQLCTVLQLKLELQLQAYLDQYLRERVAPVFLVLLDKEIEFLKHPIEESKEFTPDQVNRDVAVKRVQLMLEEYCNAHETARAAKSAAVFMKKRVNELTQNLQKASLELIQMEWLNDLSSQFVQNDKIISHHYFSDDKLSPLNLNLNRHKLLESLRSSVSQVARLLDSLKTCERTAVLVEGQLERAMGWACAGPNTSSSVGNVSKGSGIPSEFRDHLNRRRQLMQAAKEQATDILKICASVIEFEASRDGIFWKPLESPGKASDGRTWQQAYLNSLTRLDVCYHSFTRAEQEWRRAQSNMDAATSTLFSATNDLHIASAKADSASGDLRVALVAMREFAYEASDAVSAFGRVARGRAALTTECGSMLEEVLAISEGIHDVHSLGKEAAIQHKALMADLAKINMLLLPLEPMLASDVALMIDAIPDETESMIEYASNHGKKLCQKYHLRIQEACQSLQPIISPFLYSVRELHAMLMRLAKSANLHAGNLHKALEGLGDSQEMRSQEIDLSRSGLSGDGPLITSRDKDIFESGIKDRDQEVISSNEFSLPDEEWLSPPGSIYSCTTQLSYSCTEGTHIDDSSSDDNPNSTKAKEQVSYGAHIEANGDDSGVLSLIDIDEQISLSGLKTESQDMEGNKCDAGVVATDVLFESRQTSAPSSSYSDSQLSVAYNTRKDIPDTPNASDGKRRSVVDLLKEKTDKNNDQPSKVGSKGWVHKRKNAYALSVLKRVEMKLDGRGIDGDRSLSISEQVDYLLKQATSIDNLCNMYEGWTPWI
ncbi:Serine/threonine-protein kinase [Nymphaea thermarum]|nr:Serine/threonine-protein kinase [Nymphaea thermarum]